MRKLSERQELFLRTIATSKHGWTPGDRWMDENIGDGMKPEVIPTVGGGSDANSLGALVRKGLATRPRRNQHYYVITDAGREAVEKIRNRKADEERAKLKRHGIEYK